MTGKCHRQLSLLLLAAAAAACADGEARGNPPRDPDAAEAPAGGVAEVVIRAFDFQFDAPEVLYAGPNRIRMLNQGPDLHHVQLVRLEDGRTLRELVEEFRGAHAALPAWAVQVGGPNAAVPGAEAEAVVDLEPGDYALLCVIPGPDGVLHVMKGMIRPLRVLPRPAAAAPAADADVDAAITLSDYGFETAPAIAAGPRRVRVVNAAAQAHEVVVFRLEPGRTAEEVLRWVATREGAPPGLPVGGTTYLSPGQENTFRMEFAPGDYALVCFVPDAQDGRPHFMHGMVEQIRVE